MSGPRGRQVAGAGPAPGQRQPAKPAEGVPEETEETHPDRRRQAVQGGTPGHERPRAQAQPTPRRRDALVELALAELANVKRRFRDLVRRQLS